MKSINNSIVCLLTIIYSISSFEKTVFTSPLDPSNKENTIFEINQIKQNNSKNCSYSNNLPSAIIIGVKKSGTYALLRYLSINTQIKAALKIYGCNLNEIHYFDHDSNYNRGIDWYKSQMPLICDTNFTNANRKANFVVIEKTPGYFRNEKAPERIYNFNPKMKIILIVRDPVKRLLSELTHCDSRQKKYKIERKCANMNKYFESLFNKDKSNFNESSSVKTELEQNKFIRNSIYYLDMIKWFKYFNLTNIFVLNGENFIKSPWIELNKLEEFLGVDHLIKKKHFHFDKNKNFYCIKETNYSAILNNKKILKLKQLNSNSSLDKLLIPKALNYGGSAGIGDGCLGKNKGRKNHVFLSDHVKNELRKYFKKWNEHFFNLIGQNFQW